MGKQAKVLSTKDVKKVLQFISANNHAARNRAIFMCSLLGGMRACEIASLQVVAAIDSDGNVRNEIYLSPLATKGNKGRYVYVSTKLKQEIARISQPFRQRTATTSCSIRKRALSLVFPQTQSLNCLGRFTKQLELTPPAHIRAGARSLQRSQRKASTCESSCNSLGTAAWQLHSATSKQIPK